MLHAKFGWNPSSSLGSKSEQTNKQTDRQTGLFYIYRLCIFKIKLLPPYTTWLCGRVFWSSQNFWQRIGTTKEIRKIVENSEALQKNFFCLGPSLVLCLLRQRIGRLVVWWSLRHPSALWRMALRLFDIQMFLFSLHLTSTVSAFDTDDAHNSCLEHMRISEPCVELLETQLQSWAGLSRGNNILQSISRSCRPSRNVDLSSSHFSSPFSSSRLSVWMVRTAFFSTKSMLQLSKTV